MKVPRTISPRPARSICTGVRAPLADPDRAGFLDVERRGFGLAALLLVRVAGFFFAALGFVVFLRAGVFLLAAMHCPFDIRALCPARPKIPLWINGLTLDAQSEFSLSKMTKT